MKNIAMFVKEEVLEHMQILSFVSKKGNFLNTCVRKYDISSMHHVVFLTSRGLFDTSRGLNDASCGLNNISRVLTCHILCILKKKREDDLET